MIQFPRLKLAFNTSGIWSTPFHLHRTQERPFFLVDGTQKMHPIMFQSGKYLYYETDSFQAVLLPYGIGNFGTYFFLPNPTASLTDFQTLLTQQAWNTWVQKFQRLEGEIGLPRFKIEYQTFLNMPLMTMGMGEAFSNQADFSGIGVGVLQISQIIHKTVLDVNEQGTEAAVATAILMPRGAIAPSRRFSMTIDRPFFYATYDLKQRRLLFTGFVYDPD
jgi:serpin B